MTGIGQIIVLSLGGLLFSARLGLGLLLQRGPMKVLFPMVFLGYASLGFYLGHLSESQAPQSWLAWFLEGDRVMMLQVGEIFLCFVLVRISLHLFQSLGHTTKSHPRLAPVPLFLLAPSPFACIWVIFAVGSIQMARAGWEGYLVGTTVSGAFLLSALLVFLISKLTQVSVSSMASGFVLLNILVAALAVLLPAAVNLPAVEALSLSFPAGKTTLTLGLIILIIGLGFIFSYRGPRLPRRYQRVRASSR